MIERARFCLERVNLQPDTVSPLFPSEISGGMQKRVAIARAIALNPKYLFCDEPNSGLDPVTALVIDRLIEEITQEYNITTIINTHDMNSIMEIGAHIIFIEKGTKAWEGSKRKYLQLTMKHWKTLFLLQISTKKYAKHNKKLKITRYQLFNL